MRLVLILAVLGACSNGGGAKGDAGVGDGASLDASTDAGSGGGSGVTSPGRAACVGTQYFISPGGLDTNSGLAETAPLKSFGAAFAKMAPGDVLVLLDGDYSEAAGTGSLTWQSALGGQIPSGVDATKMTCVLAKNPGSVKITGALFIGRSTRKDQFIYIDGITFDGEPASLYNSAFIYIKSCGFHTASGSAGGILNVGTNDGDWGDSNALLEDVWVWGNARIGVLVYRANNIVVRRAVVRVDGCPSHTDGCGSNSGNAMVGTTIYNSHHVSLQNLLLVDDQLGPGGYPGAADIQTAWHDNFFFPFGANEWRGVISLNSELGGMYPEVDDLPGMTAYQPLFDYRDVVVAGAANGVSAQSSGSSAQKDLIIDGLTVVGGGNGDVVRIGPEFGASTSATNYVDDVIALGPGRFGINSVIPPAYADVFGTFSQGAYNQTSCSSGCLSTDPRADGTPPSLQYLTRIEPGSKLEGAGSGGASIGATVEYRYGADGAFYGAAGFDTLSTTSLWPWPAQARIQKEMCTDAGVTTGFCAKPTLSAYIWEYLGSSCPAGKCQ